MDTISTSNGRYSAIWQDDKYTIYDKDEPLLTPGGNLVITIYKPVAERILHDLDAYGYNYRSIYSILSWHFTMIDNFSRMSDERVIQILEDSFFCISDFTFTSQVPAKWKNRFGDRSERLDQISNWLSACTRMQMTAICCIGNAYRSINLSFVLAYLLQKNGIDHCDDAFHELADLIDRRTEYGPAEEIFDDFKTFELYFGTHIPEYGTIDEGVIEESNNEENEDEDEDLQSYIGSGLSYETLLGRNFRHYIDGEVEESDDKFYSFPDFELDLSVDDEDETNDDEDDDEYDDEEETLLDYIPDDCWIKRFSAIEEEGREAYYLLYIELDNDRKIESIGCLTEYVQRLGNYGGFGFYVPGIEMPATKVYEDNDYPSHEILSEMKKLIAGRALKKDQSYVDVKLPQKMIDAGGNGGSVTEYTYALQSAYRLAYMHMSVDTTEEGVIEGFSYSTYQSSGSTYGDMFSRPTCLSDREDEAIDMLLYIVDQYTDEEYESL